MYRFVFLSSLCLSPLTWAANLTVEVSSLKNADGTVRFALFAEQHQEDFPETITQAQTLEVTAQTGSITIAFHNVATGRYAISCFHDENTNDKLDKNWFQIPTEDYGFSNNPEIGMSAPSFDEATFQVDGDMRLSITLND